jgi:hypothetical protein
MLPLGMVPMRTQLSYVVSTKLGTQLLAHERAAIGVARQGLVLSLLGQRLCRILEAASAASSSREPPSVAQFAAAKLSPSARMARWKIMVVELFWVLRNFELKCCAQEVLGRSAYLRIFQQIESTKEQVKDIPLKIIDGQVVGKPLPQGQGTGNVDPVMRQHLKENMKTRANKTEEWWTCAMCQSRWERQTVEGHIPTGNRRIRRRHCSASTRE